MPSTTSGTPVRGALVELHVDVTADPLEEAGGEPRHVLAWDLIGVMA